MFAWLRMSASVCTSVRMPCRTAATMGRPAPVLSGTIRNTGRLNTKSQTAQSGPAMRMFSAVAGSRPNSGGSRWTNPNSRITSPTMPAM